MLQAVVIVLMLNGVQVDLPAPAYLIGNYAYVPARAVLEHLGCEVAWDAAKAQARVQGPGGVALLTVGSTALTWERGAPPGGSSGELPAAPLELNGMLYVPVRAVEALTQVQVSWDPATLTVSLAGVPSGESAVASLAEILSDPPNWAGRAVTLRGEYTGWQPDSFGPATSQGPPVTRSDWGLRDGGGSVYCTGEPSNDDAPKLEPLTSLGQRLEVTGVVLLADAGFPYVRLGQVRALTGLAGVACYLTTERLRYASGDTVRLQMKVHNWNAEPVVLEFSTGQTYDFEVVDVEGNRLWRWSDDKVFTQALQQRSLGAGEEYVVQVEWTAPVDLGPGSYQARGLINREVQAYPTTFQVVAGG